MSVPDLLRDSFFGRVVYYASGRRVFRYPEEKDGFVLPPRYAGVSHHLPPHSAQSRRSNSSARTSYSATLLEERRAVRPDTDVGTGPTLSEKPAEVSPNALTPPNEPQSEKGRIIQVHQSPNLPRHESTAAEEVLHLHGRDDEELGATERQFSEKAENPYIVDWYGPDDPESPQNVSASPSTMVLHIDRP